MRRPSPLLLAVLPVFLLACGDQSSAAPPSTDGGTSSFTYTPMGCSYSFAPPSAWGFTDVSLDDTGAVSSTAGAPERVRVGLGGGVTKGKTGYADPTTSAAFTWETSESNHAAKVRYGTSAGAMGTTQTGYTWTTPGSLGGAPTHMHEVHVCGLKPATHYYYQVGGGPSGKEVWGATQDFTTAPASGTVTLGIFGDARDKVGTWQVVHERMREAQVNLQLVDGDIVDAAALEQNYTDWLNAIWKDPNNASSFLTLGQQMMVPINGNHENDHANSFAAWAIPAVAGDANAKTYASFDVGSAHIVMVDDLHLSAQVGGVTDPVATKQLAWLEADLTAADADRAAHPFIIALSHRGMYSTSLHSGEADVLAVRGALAPLYDKHKVDIVFNGHDHEYERSLPLHPNASDPMSSMVMPGTGGASYSGAQGTTYVVCAGAGADPYAIGKASPNYALPSTQTAFCAAGAGCTSYIGVYSIVTVAADKLTLNAYGFKASSSSITNDTVIDTVTLTKQ